jgi:hypothetical protein
MYEALARTVLLEEDAKVAREVDRVRSRHPRFSDAEVVGRLTERVAWRCAAVAAIVSAGQPLLGRLATTADLSFQTLSLSRMALSIGHARRRPMTVVERGLAAGASLVLAGAAAAVRTAAGRGARSALRRKPELAPIVTALVGGAVAYVSARLLGRAVEEFLGNHPRRRR